MYCKTHFLVLIVLFLTLTSSAQETKPDITELLPETRNFTPFGRETKIATSQGLSANGSGTSVSISGTTAVVGSNLDDNNNNVDQGSAYVYVYNFGTWTLQTKLTAGDGATGDKFGSSVAIDGNTIIVGAPRAGGANANQGAAYIFTRTGSTWTQQVKLTGADGLTDDNFGNSVDVKNNTAVVGANLDDHPDIGTGNFQQGSAYIFVRSGSTWTQQTKLRDPNGTDNMNYGVSVALEADRVVIGANNFNGFCYLYTRTGTAWTLYSRFQPDDVETQQSFGTAVDIVSDVIVVGSRYKTIVTNGTTVTFRQGATYVFQIVTLNNLILQTQRILAADGAANDEFGSAVAFDGTSIIVGTNKNDVGANTDQGSSYVYIKDATQMWTLQTQLTGVAGAADDNFGNSVGVAGNLFINGAVLDDIDGRVDQGSAQAFVRNTNNTYTQGRILAAEDPKTNDFFGYSTAMDGSTTVVGAAFEDVGGNQDQGALYVYSKSNGVWALQAKLLAADGMRGDSFGYRVSISGDTIVAGAVSDDNPTENQGSVYVFTRSGMTWTQQAKLTALDGAAFDSLGASVAIDGNTIVAGANHATVGGIRQVGAAYFFSRSGTTWTQQAKISPSDGAIEDNFGWSAAIVGNTAIVGSITDDTGDIDGHGSAYIFTNNGTWTETQKITPENLPEAGAYSGSLAFDGTTIAVGAFFTTVNGNSTQGAAYTYTNVGGSWTQQAKLLASDGAAGDYLGSGIDVDDDTLVVAAQFDDVGDDTNEGTVYIFERTGQTWTQRQIINSSDGKAFDSFGGSVAVSGTEIAVGAPMVDIIAPNSLSESTFAPAVNENQGAEYFYSSVGATAATVNVSGIVRTPRKRRFDLLTVTLLSSDGASVTVKPNKYGEFTFEDIRVGGFYVIKVNSQVLTFEPSFYSFNLFEELSGIEFIGHFRGSTNER